MESDLPNTEVLMKVRDANCLAESEFQMLTAALAETQVRRALDVLDFEWENNVKKYVSLYRSKGGREGLIMSSWDDVVGGTIIGLALFAWGTYMLWQFSQEKSPGDGLLAALFFGLITAVGAWIIFKCWKASKAVSQYDQGRVEYLSNRKLLTDQLPAESRFPVRYCPNCLSRIWHTNQHPSSPPRSIPYRR